MLSCRQISVTGVPSSPCLTMNAFWARCRPPDRPSCLAYRLRREVELRPKLLARCHANQARRSVLGFLLLEISRRHSPAAPKHFLPKVGLCPYRVTSRLPRAKLPDPLWGPMVTFSVTQRPMSPYRGGADTLCPPPNVRVVPSTEVSQQSKDSLIPKRAVACVVWTDAAVRRLRPQAQGRRPYYRNLPPAASVYFREGSGSLWLP